jgi:hypothetical protein
MNNNNSKFKVALQAMSSILGGWFLVIFIIISAFTIFMCICNCVVYSRVIANGDDPNISSGFAWVLLFLNIALAILALFVFFYILLKWSKFNDIKAGYMEFTTQNVVNATFDKSVNPAIQQRKNTYAGIINQDILLQTAAQPVAKPTYTAQELENLSFNLKPEFMTNNPGSLESFMNKYD